MTRFLNNVKVNDAYTLPTADGTSGQSIVTNGSGILSFTDIVNTVLVADTATGDGSTVAFSLSNTITNENNVQVFLDGVYQSKSNYSTAGTTVTFTTAPPNGTAIEFTHLVSVAGSTGVDVDVFSGNGATTAFTLTTEPMTKNNLQIYIDGVYQAKANYSTSGTTLTFTTAPPSGTSNIEVTHIKIA